MTTSPPTAPHRAGPTAVPARASAYSDGRGPDTAARGPAGARPPDEPAPPIYLVPTLIGALAILAATIAIPPMISGEDWFWPTFEVVMVIWLVGVGARLARVPAAAAILLQVLGAGVALTALFTTGGIGGVIPNGAVIGEAGELLTGAWEQIRTTVSPTPASTELSFLICLSVGATALIVDILIAVCRAPALVALPLLCVFSVPASIDLAMLPWEAFAAPAMLYAILLIASGLTGRRLGAGAGLAQIVNGVALAALATVIALVVAGSVTGVGTAGRLPRSSAGPSAGVGLSPFASLQGNLQRSEPVDMLSVSGLTEPKYLRTVGLQKWTEGQGWSIDQLTDGQLPSAPLPAQQAVTVTALSYRDQFLPIYNGTTQVNGADAAWSYDAALESVHRVEPLTPAPYEIDAVFAEPTAEELRTDDARPGGVLTETGDLRPEVVEIATQVTAGATTAFDKADALRSYFTDTANGFSYSLSVPPGDSGDPLVDFLNNKQGYCEQYASAMAIMLRAVGVPARVAIGFTQGEKQSDGSYLISSNDAHAWVEVQFDRAGWVQFDPTPLTGGQGRQQGFAEDAGAVPSIGALPSDDVPSDGASADEPTERAVPTAQTSAGAGAAGSADNEPAVAPGWWFVLAILALVAAAAAGPTVVRRRRRDHRLAAADAGGAGAAAAAWREIEDLAVDHGIGLNPAESARATANRLAKATHLSEHGRAELRTLVAAVERGWYSGSPEAAGAAAPGARSVRGLPSDGRVGDGHSAGGPSVAGAGDSARPVAATDTLARPAAAEALGAAPRTIALELQHHVPLAPLDRLVPRSVRPAWWRD